jgi:transcriptional regulator with XRE-family HTH domain
MDIGIQMVRLRKSRGFSQQELANKVETSREMIGKYEREEVVPSVEMAKKIAGIFEVTLDFLVDQDSLAALDRETLQRIQAIQEINEPIQQSLIDVIDACIRDAHIQKAYKKN